MASGNRTKTADGLDIIHMYGLAQAIADGVLVDVTATAREAGFQYPLALTRAVYDRFVQVPEGVFAQDEAGRLWDILWMLSCTIQSAKGRPVPVVSRTDRILFQVLVRNDNRRTDLVKLKAICGPGDEGEPVITVMLPDED